MLAISGNQSSHQAHTSQSPGQIVKRTKRHPVARNLGI
jgi:hypothetical protein